MKAKGYFITSLIFLETTSIIILFTLLGSIREDLFITRMFVAIMMNMIPVGIILITIRFTIIKAVLKITGFIRNSFDTNKNYEQLEIETGFVFINILKNALNTYRIRTRELIQNVEYTTGQSYKLGEKLSTHTVSSLGQVEKITSRIDSVGNDIINLDSNVVEITKSVERIFINIKMLSDQINYQNDFLEGMSSSALQMVSSTEDIAQHTRTKHEITTSLVNLTISGEQKLEETSQHIEEISRQTGRILQMISVINDIAGSTNLLAINASIEAAHAADSGKGFSVVANEIRSLAENTAENADTISEALLDIVDKIKNANNAGMNTKSVFKEISRQTNEVAAGLNEITDEMDHLADAERNIHKSSSDLLKSNNAIKKTGNEIRMKTTNIEKAMKELRDISNLTAERIESIIASTALLNILFIESSTLVNQNLINIDDLARNFGRNTINLNEISEIKIGINWTENLSVLDSTIDQQHRDLIKNVNGFLKSLIFNKHKGEIQERIELMIDNLKKDVISHFSDEESFLEVNGYPDIKEHQRNHRQYIERISKLEDEYIKNGLSPTLISNVQQDIALGLIRHIYYADMLYKDFFLEPVMPI